MNENCFIRSKDGHQLFFRAHVVSPSAANIVLIHGFAEHSARYEHVIDAIQNAQMNVFAFDLRGHGKSEGRRGYIDCFSQYVEDLDAAVDFVLKKMKTKKVGLIAHSMGALVATHYAGLFGKNLFGMVLSSPLLGIRGDVPKWKKIAGRLMSRFHPSFSLPSSIHGNDLTHDVERARSYDTDPLVFHHVAARWYTEIQKACLWAQEMAPRLKVPFLLQLSNADRVVDDRQSLRWFQRGQVSDKTQLIYDGFFHEIYNETECERPITDAVDWLLARSMRKIAKPKRAVSEVSL